MRKNQDGFIGVAFAIAFAAIGAATIAVQESHRITNASINSSEKSREKEKINDSALNAAARYKALLSARKDPATGDYIPGIYAIDYFADPTNWQMRRSAAIGGLTDVQMQGGDNRVVQLKAGTPTKQVMALSEKVFAQQAVAANVNKEFLDVEITNLKVAAFGEKGAGFLVKSADIKVTGKKDDLSKASPVVVRVPMEAPIPHDMKLQYRLQGTAVWIDMNNDVKLADDVYEFRVLGSGIMLGAKFYWNGGPPMDLGYNAASGTIEHGARNFEAKDVQIGPVLAGDFNLGAAVDPATCVAPSISSTYTVQASLIGVDGEEYEKSKPLKFELSTATKEMSIDDYRTTCTAQCAYQETTAATGGDPATGIDAGDLDAWWTRRGRDTDNPPDISGEWTRQEAFHENIKSEKMCVSFVGMTPDKHMFKDATYVKYKEPKCDREIIGKRGACGCVSEDTKILMGDGKTEKRIDEVRRSDMIWNPLLKKALAVREVTRGPEKVPMLKVSVGDRVIDATGNHPFPTRTGMKTAFTLSQGEEIMLEGQGWQAIKAIEPVAPTAKAPVVWNIEVEAPNDDQDAHHYVANGVVTGDLLIQKKLQNAAKNNTAQN